MSDNNKQVDVYFVRRGDTISDKNGLTSAVESNQPLTKEATEKTQELSNVYKALVKEGRMPKDTPIHTGNPQSLIATAANLVGIDREEIDPKLQRNSSLNKRYKYKRSDEHGRTWEGIITKKLDNEIGDLIEARQSREAHRHIVTNTLGLTKTTGESPSMTPPEHSINDNPPKSQIVVAHTSTINRLMEHFDGIGEEGKNNKLIEDAVVHHAHSNDGGKTWTVKRVDLDKSGKIQETDLKERTESNERSFEDILKTHKTTISTDKDGSSTLTVNVDRTKTNQKDRKALADDLGKLLIGNNYDEVKNEKGQSLVRISSNSVEVELDKARTEIVKTFAKLKKIELPENSRQIG
ncbi:MAG: hypothetical protein R3D71_03340 [Rickettsiales bacterium]